MSRSEYDPSAEQEVEHLAEQCSTLLREVERKDAEIVSLRAALELVRDAVEWNNPQTNGILLRIKMVLEQSARLMMMSKD